MFTPSMLSVFYACHLQKIFNQWIPIDTLDVNASYKRTLLIFHFINVTQVKLVTTSLAFMAYIKLNL